MKIGCPEPDIRLRSEGLVRRVVSRFMGPAADEIASLTRPPYFLAARGTTAQRQPIGMREVAAPALKKLSGLAQAFFAFQSRKRLKEWEAPTVPAAVARVVGRPEQPADLPPPAPETCPARNAAHCGNDSRFLAAGSPVSSAVNTDPNEHGMHAQRCERASTIEASRTELNCRPVLEASSDA